MKTSVLESLSRALKEESYLISLSIALIAVFVTFYISEKYLLADVENNKIALLIISSIMLIISLIFAMQKIPSIGKSNARQAINYIAGFCCYIFLTCGIVYNEHMVISVILTNFNYTPVERTQLMLQGFSAQIKPAFIFGGALAVIGCAAAILIAKNELDGTTKNEP